MPGGNGTGPMGMGPMSGRGAGFCAGNGVAGYAGGFCGMGRGAGLGRGNGRRNMFLATGLTGWQRATGGAPALAVPTKAQEVDALKGQAEYLENALAEIKQRMQGLAVEKSAQ